MTVRRRDARSPYMEWAKRHAGARYDLAASGVGSLRLAELPARLEDLELTGSPGYGYPPLLERLAAKAGVAPENVVTAAGTSMANHLALAALLEPGDEALIESPTYELLVTTALYLGAEVRRFPRRFDDGFGVDPDAVAAALTPRTRLVVVTNLHNPSGVRTGDRTLARVADLARRGGARLLVDEVYLQALFDPAARSAFHLGPGIVATGSLTKAYGLSGLRCGWVLAEPALAERMWRIDDLHGASAAHPAERLSVVALDHLGPIAARAKERLDKNRALLHRFLDGRPDLEAVRPEAGTVVFPRLAGGNGDRVEALCDLLREHHETSVVPGRFFDMPGHFRLGIGATTPIVDEGLRRLGRALDELGEELGDRLG